MRYLPYALAALLLLSIAGCAGPSPVTPTIIVPTSSPTSSATIAPTDTVAPVAIPVTATPPATTTRSATPRAAAATRTPVAAPPAATRTDDLPIPFDARDTRNIPVDLRDFMTTQLKGQSRLGQPHGYLSPHAVTQVLDQYQQALTTAGWETVPIAADLAQTQLLVAQKAKLQAVIALVDQGDAQTLVYVVMTTRK
jgi:hypothetical protein